MQKAQQSQTIGVVLLLLTLMTIPCMVMSEESSILSSCFAVDHNTSYKRYSNRVQDLISGNFQLGFTTTAEPPQGTPDLEGSFEVQIQCPDLEGRIVSVFIANQCNDNATCNIMGRSQIYLGDDTASFSQINDQVYDNIFSGGFFQIPHQYKGKTLSIRRNGYDLNNFSFLRINEIRVFQVPNLLSIFDVEIIASHTPVSPEFEASNLLANFPNRSPNSEFAPLIDAQGNSDPSKQSCYKVNKLAITDNLYVLGLHFTEFSAEQTLFMHSILITQDHYYLRPEGPRDQNYYFYNYFQNFRIYIGESLDYTENAECPGGPFMSFQNPDDVWDYHPDFGNENLWRYGKEIWCNLPGKVMHIVADLSQVSDFDYEMSICSLGVMGVQYVTKQPKIKKVTVYSGLPKFFSVLHFYVDTPELLGNDYGFATRLKEGDTMPDWIDDPIDQKPGEEIRYNILYPEDETDWVKYVFTIESYDPLSTVQSTIFASQIEITARPRMISAFTSLPLLVFYAGAVNQTIILPKVWQGHGIRSVDYNCNLSGRTQLEWSKTETLWPLNFDGQQMEDQVGLTGQCSFELGNPHGDINEQIFDWEIQQAQEPAFVSNPTDLQVITGFQLRYKLPDFEESLHTPFSVNVTIPDDIKTLVTFNETDSEIFAHPSDSWAPIEGIFYTLNITIIDSIGQRVVYESKISSSPYVAPVFESEPATIELWEDEQLFYEIPLVIDGSYLLKDISYSIEPCCLSSFLSQTKEIGQVHESSGQIVRGFVDLFNNFMEYEGDAFPESFYTSPQTFLVQWVLTDESGTSTTVPIKTQAFVKRPLPPSFSSIVPDLLIVPGEEFSYTYPDVIEGSHPGVYATATFSESLSEYIHLDFNTNLELKNSDDTCQLKDLHSDSDLFVTVRLTDGDDKKFQDFQSKITVVELIEPSFAVQVAPQAQVKAGLPSQFAYSEILDGTNKPTTVDIQVNTELSSRGFSLTENSQGVLVANYDGDYSLSELKGIENLNLTVTLTDSQQCTTSSYSTEIEVLLPQAPKFISDPVQEVNIISGKAQNITLPLIIDGDKTPTTAIITMSDLLVPHMIVNETKSAVSLMITLKYDGSLTIKSLEEIEDLFVDVRLLDGLEKVFTDYRISVKVEKGSPPTFVKEPDANIDIFVGTPGIFHYPLATEGDVQPASFEIQMNHGLEQYLTVNQEQSKLSGLLFSLDYNGGEYLRSLASKTDLKVQIKLYDGIKRVFTDYVTNVKVSLGIPVKFLEAVPIPKLIELVTGEAQSIQWVTDGLAKYAPGFANFTKSESLQSYVSISQKAVTQSTFMVVFAYDGDAKLKQLTNVADLWIKIRLWDDKQTTFTDYEFVITVNTEDPPQFSQTLPALITLYPGAPYLWTLPSTRANWFNQIEISPKIPPVLLPFLLWDQETETMQFNGDLTSSSLKVRKDLVIDFELKNEGGWQSQLTQSVIFADPIAPVFTSSNLPGIEIEVGSPLTFTYPEIQKGTHPLVDPILILGPVLQLFLSFDVSEMQLKYDGNLLLSVAASLETYEIQIRLVDILGTSTVYSQSIKIIETENVDNVSDFFIPNDEDEISDIQDEPEISDQIVTIEDVVDESIIDANSTDIAIDNETLNEGDIESSKMTDSVAQVADNILPDEEVLDKILEVEPTAMSVALGIPNVVIPPVSKKQLALLETPVDDIPPEEVFTPIPLVARLTTGVKNVKQLVLKQREIITSMATDTSRQSGPRPPETRIKGFDNAGGIKMGFTSKIGFPQGIKDRIQKTNEENKRRLSEGLQPKQNLVDVYAVKEEEGEPEEAGSAIMNGWELVSINENGIELKLDFGDPLLVSKSDQPDLLLIQFDFSEFKDENGDSLPSSLVKYSPIPTQMASQAEAEQVQAQGDAANSSSKAALGSNVIVNVALAGSMNQVWSIINGLQIVNYLPLFKVKSPGNVNSFAQFFAEIAKLDLIDTSQYTDGLVYIPELDSFSLNFMNAGYDSSLVLPNLGTLLFVLAGQVSLFFVFILVWILAKCCKRIRNTKEKLRYYLFWNGTIRIFMEGYLDFTLMSLLNIREIFWQENLLSVTICNYFAIVMTCLCGLIPIILFIYLDSNIKSWNEKEFRSSYGVLLEGTNGNKSESIWIISLVPGLFFLRRLALCLTLVFWQDFFWGQIAIQLGICTLMVIILKWFEPLESKFANNIETFNEVISTFIIYLMMCFSDFVNDLVMRNLLGKVFIAIVCLYAAVHIFFLTADMFYKVKLNLLRCFYRRCRKRPITSPPAPRLDKPNNVEPIVIEVPWVEREQKQEVSSNPSFSQDSNRESNILVDTARSCSSPSQSSRSMLRPQAQSILTQQKKKPRGMVAKMNQAPVDLGFSKFKRDLSIAESLDSLPEITEHKCEEEEKEPQTETQSTSFWNSSMDQDEDTFEQRATRIELSRFAAISTFKRKQIQKKGIDHDN